MINTSHIGKAHSLESTLPTQPSRRADSTPDNSEFARFLTDLVEKVDKIDTAGSVAHGPTTEPVRQPDPVKK